MTTTEAKQMLALWCAGQPLDDLPKWRMAMQVMHREHANTCAALKKANEQAEVLRAGLIELRDRIKDHPAYADLTEAEEIEMGGDTAEFSYLARMADEALGPSNQL